MSYQQVKIELKDEIDNTKIKRLSDSAMIPADERNIDWQAYLKWLGGYEAQFNSQTHQIDWVKTSNGNTPLPADE
jgi:hypothetical protein